MAAKQWTEKQTKEVMKKVIRRAEVSRIARLLQHRLALANVKAQHGWENLTLDAIEPKVEEDLKRKRQKTSQDNTPSPQKPLFSEAEVESLRRDRPTSPPERPSSQASDIGPLPTFQTTSRKRCRNPSDYRTPMSNKRHRTRKDPNNNSNNSNNSSRRMIKSSPGYYDYNDGRHRAAKFQPTFHSSPPRTPPRRLIKPIGGRDKNTGEEGADLLLFLATSPSPASAAMPKTRYIPTTPPSRSSALPSSMMTTPGGYPQTPQTGFNFADFVNITPSPAQGAFGAVGRGTPIANARKRLNFDQLVPPSESPPTRGTGLGMELGGNLIS